LLNAGAEVLVKDYDGKTPLYYAGKFGNKEIEELLLAKEDSEKLYKGTFKFLISAVWKCDFDGIIIFLQNNDKSAILISCSILLPLIITIIAFFIKRKYGNYHPSDKVKYGHKV
jgi:ankyrin repeat protein